MKESIIPEELIRLYCKESHNIAEFCRKCGWKPLGANYRTFHKYVKLYNLDTSHFTSYRTNTGNVLNVGLSDEELFSDRGIDVCTSTLRSRLLKANYKEYKCEKCGITKWNEEPISLLIHHIDENRTNNSLENLLLLCPNCHSLTDSYAGKKNVGRKTTTHIITPKHTCSLCGKRLHRATKTGLCRECLILSNKQKKSASKETLNVEER